VTLGAVLRGEGRCTFRVWAPSAKTASLRIVEPEPRSIPMEAEGRGYFFAETRAGPGSLYFYRFDDSFDRPDPASRFQPRGVHGPSEVVDPEFPWTDSKWEGLPLEELAFYEIHVGIFTPEGTFEAAVGHLDGLKELGVTALEIMPVAQFPGERNWGYDGVFPFAPQNSYGGPRGLKRLVDECHARGMAAVLDVVYNHLGPEGNCLWGLAPYFTDRYKTPWGPAMNFDGPGSDEVRRYFIENALYWIRDFHFDALRLDAVHAIIDVSARPFLQELAEQVREAGRPAWLIAESGRNDPRMIRSPERGGLGLDALWNDDFHHSLRGVLTGEKAGYYQDFGSIEQLGRAMTQGFVYSGHVSAYRGRRHGAPLGEFEGRRLVVFSQNHDQVGNRMKGERLAALVPFEKLKLAAGAVVLSPNLPLLFMGEEYGETRPFLYFVSHSDPSLIEAVRRGRREEFARFLWEGEPPDPQGEAAFSDSKLDRSALRFRRNEVLRALYKKLFELRRTLPALAKLDPRAVTVSVEGGTMSVLRADLPARTRLFFNFSDERATLSLPAYGGVWTRVLDSSDGQWNGAGALSPSSLDLERPAELALSPWSLAVYDLTTR
jgi:maltooligosyltrehalose trehalohydrolase